MFVFSQSELLLTQCQSVCLWSTLVGLCTGTNILGIAEVVHHLKDLKKHTLFTFPSKVLKYVLSWNFLIRSVYNFWIQFSQEWTNIIKGIYQVNRQKLYNIKRWTLNIGIIVDIFISSYILSIYIYKIPLILWDFVVSIIAFI